MRAFFFATRRPRKSRDKKISWCEGDLFSSRGRAMAIINLNESRDRDSARTSAYANKVLSFSGERVKNLGALFFARFPKRWSPESNRQVVRIPESCEIWKVFRDRSTSSPPSTITMPNDLVALCRTHRFSAEITGSLEERNEMLRSARTARKLIRNAISLMAMCYQLFSRNVSGNQLGQKGRDARGEAQSF